jgi:hypothetical protein
VATLTTAAGSSIQVLSSNYSSTLSVTNPFTNAGTIDLTNNNSTNYGVSSTLTVGGGTGTLTNASGGLITSSSISGGANYRALNAVLVNQAGGTLTATYPLTITDTSGAASNAGTINANANIAFTLTGTAPSLTNTGTVAIGSGATFTVSGGTFNYTGGSVGSVTTGGTLSLQSTTANLASDFSDAATALLLGASTVNGPGKLINVAGVSLALG